MVPMLLFCCDRYKKASQYHIARLDKLGCGLPALSVEVPVAYRSVLYHMVFYYRGCGVTAMMSHSVVVAVAGAQGYNAYYGKAPFEELIHISCFSIC